jgi:replicative DNA helicase
MTASKSYSDKRAELSLIYTELRDMGVEKNLAIVTASQANRSSLSMDLVSIEHIAEDFGKVAIADIIVTISQNSAERVGGKMRFYMAKNRDGSVDEVIPTYVNYSNMTLGDVSHEADDIKEAIHAPTK